MYFKTTITKKNKQKVKTFDDLAKCRKYLKRNKKYLDIIVEMFIHPEHSIKFYKSENGRFENDYNYPIYL